MRESLSRALLWLFVINLGVVFGAGLYEGRIVVSQWLISSPETGFHWNAEAARRDDTGLRFWVFVTTVRWANFNYVRHAIVLTAWLAALKAFALVYQHRSAGTARM